MKIYKFPNEEKLLKQIQAEYKEGYEHVLKKRQAKQNEIKDYVESTDKKIKKHIIYTFMQTYMSVFYVGTLNVRWSSDGGRIQTYNSRNLIQIFKLEYNIETQLIYNSRNLIRIFKKY